MWSSRQANCKQQKHVTHKEKECLQASKLKYNAHRYKIIPPPSSQQSMRTMLAVAGVPLTIDVHMQQHAYTCTACCRLWHELTLNEKEEDRFECKQEVSRAYKGCLGALARASAERPYTQRYAPAGKTKAVKLLPKEPMMALMVL